MSTTLKFGYPKISTSSDGTKTYQEVYSISTKEEALSFYNTFSLGVFYTDKGYIDSMSAEPSEGRMWDLIVNYKISRDEEGNIENGTDEWGRKTRKVSHVDLKLPIENLSNYLYSWNHTLWAWCENENSIPETPSFWLIAIDSYVTDGFAWSEASNSPPPDPTSDAKQTQLKAGWKWYLVEDRLKKFDTYDFSRYTLTETAKYPNMSSALSAMDDKANKIVTLSGLSALPVVDWLAKPANTQKVKNYILVTWTYEGSPDGWDTDIYANA